MQMLTPGNKALLGTDKGVSDDELHLEKSVKMNDSCAIFQGSTRFFNKQAGKGKRSCVDIRLEITVLWIVTSTANK